ncbi:MAG: transcriptional regulator, TetR family [Caulobacter sp.]|nr:transcriptional regulator, TetR family [Caulobacter sp.]
MVQNSEPKRRGRPRAYDPDVALGKLRAAFWDNGYAGASLDDLSAAAGMNRPSLYNAFGDKQAVFQTVMDRYRADGRAAMTAAFLDPGTLRQSLERIYAAALAIYLSGEGAARGCFLIGVGLAEAVNDPAVRDTVAAGLRELDRGFDRRMIRAQADGDLPPDADPLALARVASGMLNALAVRSRAGEPRERLEAFAQAAIDLICGTAKKTPEPQASE